MRKILPIALALGLTAQSLIGNPLRDTTENILSITRIPEISMEETINMKDDLDLNVSVDSETKDNKQEINDLSIALRKKNFYIGVSYKDLETDTLLENSQMIKTQVGIRPFKFLNGSITGAEIDVPKMKSLWEFNIPMKFYSFGWSIDLEGKLQFKGVDFLPWISSTGSAYSANLLHNQDFEKMIEEDDTDLSELSITYPLDHLKINAGIDIDTEFVKLGYEGVYDGEFYTSPIFKYNNIFKIQAHIDNYFNLGYNLIIESKTGDGEFKAPVRNNLSMGIDLFARLKNSFLKGNVTIDSLPKNNNAVIAIGHTIKEGNFELFYNIRDKTLGLKFSSDIQKEIEEKDYTTRKFYEVKSPKEKDISSDYVWRDIDSLHAKWGNTLEAVIPKIKTESDLSAFISNIPQKSHEGIFTAKEIYEVYGYGVCKDLNGVLIPYIASKAFGYKCYGRKIIGPYLPHVIAIIKDIKGYDIRDYADYYDLDAKTEEEAIEAVFPGMYKYGNGEVSHIVSEIRKGVEEKLYEW